MDVNNVVPFKGLDNVRLGASRSEVVQALGHPETQEQDASGDAVWNYVVGISCTFSAEDDCRLHSITFSRRNYTLMGESVVGIEEHGLLELAERGLLPPVSLDDEWPELDTKNYACDSLGVDFWLVGNVVRSFTVFPRYDAGGQNPVWS